MQLRYVTCLDLGRSGAVITQGWERRVEKTGSEGKAVKRLINTQIVRYGFINGLPGFITIERGDILQTTALQIEDGRIVAVYVTRNPDKLRHVAATVH